MSGGYGAGPDILHDCTIAVNPGEIAVIVGPNGAGKSTAMKAVFGMLNVRKGSVRLDGEDITDLSPQARVLKGMGFVPQTSQHLPLADGGGKPRDGGLTREDDFRETMAQVLTCSRSSRTSAARPPASLSGGQRQQVAVGRALMTAQGPDAGRTDGGRLAHRDGRAVRPDHRGRPHRHPILMVEQNARQALEIADKGYVLVQGAQPLHRHGQTSGRPGSPAVAGHLPHRIARRDVFLQRHRALCDRTRRPGVHRWRALPDHGPIVP
jgi:branched-chain amino acid transport system ATP-binding protein